MPVLTPAELNVIALERKTWRSSAAKEQAVHDTLGLSMTRYAQVVNHLLDQPAVFMLDPQLVSRLRRLRAERQARRG